MPSPEPAGGAADSRAPGVPVNWPADWIVPDWPAPPGVHALCTTRAGGVSEDGYASLNLGVHSGDRPAQVAANRERLQRAIGARPVFLRQVHGTDVAALTEASADDGPADACTTDKAGVACTIMVADCLPVLVCDSGGARVAAAHCGWRGLAAGVLERTCESFWPPAPVERAHVAMKTIANGTPGTALGVDAQAQVRVDARARAEQPRAPLIAWLGPCIGPAAFEVGPEVKAAFESQAPEAASCFRPGGRPGKWLADLPGLARQRLRAMGVTQVYGNDGSAPWCTVGNPLRFFSYRRDGAASGRFAALIWRA